MTAMKIIAVIGEGRRSGKTVTIEHLVKEFKRDGLRVGTVKRIHHEDFSIDTKKKDTWRHAEAGADVVVSSAPHEIAAIKRTESGGFEDVLKLLEKEGLDVIIVEGSPGINVPKIFAGRDAKTTKRLLDEMGGEILCVSTLHPKEYDGRDFNVPLLHPEKDVKRIVGLVRERLAI